MFIEAFFETIPKRGNKLKPRKQLHNHNDLNILSQIMNKHIVLSTQRNGTQQ